MKVNLLLHFKEVLLRQPPVLINQAFTGPRTLNETQIPFSIKIYFLFT